MTEICEREDLVSCHEQSGICEETPDELDSIEIINGFPVLETGMIAGKYTVGKRIGWDDRVGATFLANDEENKLVVLRLSNEECSVAKMETSFLSQVEKNSFESLFSQVHSVVGFDRFYILALNFRAGPSLQQCLDTSKNKKLSHGTGARLAEDVLVILHAIHKMGYAAGSLSTEAFHFDEATRHLFMADISEIRKRNGTKNEKKPIYWFGGPHFAPIAYHMDSYEEDGMSLVDEVESWFYLYLHLVYGLPWEHMNIDDLKWSKLDYDTLDKEFKCLPKQYRSIYDTIVGETGEMSDKAYNDVLRMVREIYTDVGGVEDRMEKFDFESEPIVHKLECIPEENEDEE